MDTDRRERGIQQYPVEDLKQTLEHVDGFQSFNPLYSTDDDDRMSYDMSYSVSTAGERSLPEAVPEKLVECMVSAEYSVASCMCYRMPQSAREQLRYLYADFLDYPVVRSMTGLQRFDCVKLLNKYQNGEQNARQLALLIQHLPDLRHLCFTAKNCNMLTMAKLVAPFERRIDDLNTCDLGPSQVGYLLKLIARLRPQACSLQGQLQLARSHAHEVLGRPLASVTKLDLSYSRSVDVDMLACFPSVRQLVMRRVSIQGQSLQALRSLLRLELLDLSDNEWIKQVPLVPMKRLRELIVAGCSLGWQRLFTKEMLPALESLDVSHTRLNFPTDVMILVSLYGRQLTRLAVTGCPTRGSLLAHVRKFPNLTCLAASVPPTWHANHTIYYQYQAPPGPPLSQLTSLCVALPPVRCPTNFPLELTPRLRHLQLVHARLDPDLAFDISRLRHLRELSLPHVRASDGLDLAMWMSLEALRAVSLYAGDVTLAVLRLLTTCPALEEVDLRRCSHVREADVDAILLGGASRVERVGWEAPTARPHVLAAQQGFRRALLKGAAARHAGWWVAPATEGWEARGGPGLRDGMPC